MHVDAQQPFGTRLQGVLSVSSNHAEDDITIVISQGLLRKNAAAQTGKQLHYFSRAGLVSKQAESNQLSYFSIAGPVRKWIG